MSNKQEISTVLIENRIFTCRGEQVMLDYHLAELYHVETKRLNEQVKRNDNRFPKTFMFQLSELEWKTLQSQIATAEKTNALQSQIATAKRRTLPYVFTEQGVSMLSAVLNSDIAVTISIQIMNAFVQMRKTIGNHQQLLQLSNDFVAHKLETDQKFEQVCKALEAPEIKNKQGIFFDGQTYDAYDFVNELIKKAHDRFLILDQTQVYHIGALLKDLGKKWFAFSKLESDSVTVVNEIKELI